MKREAIAYVIVGGITTGINMLVYHLCCNVGAIPNLLANGLAWVAAVIFAYFANDRLVFTDTKGGGFQAECKKMGRFFAARLFSLLVDEAGMFLLVDLLLMNNMFAKVAMNVIIVLLNFFLSKCFIFKK